VLYLRTEVSLSAFRFAEQQIFELDLRSIQDFRFRNNKTIMI
jgi:hypothetical protein